jgi:DNA-binding transcriptional LysR family regulator
VAVAEELHFGRAAARLHIAQPSLSHQIRRLEQQLGVRLLTRTSRRVELTASGETLLAEGRRLLADAQRVLRDTRAAACRHVTVGFYGSAADAQLPGVLRAFAQRHPDVEVDVRDLRLEQIDQLLTGSVDVAFTRLLPDQLDPAHELQVEVLAHEPRVLALAVGHPLAGQPSLAFRDLGQESFITNPLLAEGERPARWLAEQTRHGLPGRVAGRATSVQELLTLVASGRGVSLVPASVAERYHRPDVSYVEVADAEPAVVSLVWPRPPVRPEVDAFVETARSSSANAARDASRNAAQTGD